MASSWDGIHEVKDGARRENAVPSSPTTTTLRIGSTKNDDPKNGSLTTASPMATVTNTIVSSRDADSSPPFPRKAISYLCAALVEQQQPKGQLGTLYYFITPSFKQSLFVFLVFVLGIYTGISYVGWVQYNYGFGKDPAMENKCLPYGPHTLELRRAHHHHHHRRHHHYPWYASSGSALSTANEPQIPAPRKNHENPILSTLFGIDYSNHFVGGGRPSPSASTGNNDAAETNHDTEILQKQPTPASIVVSPTWYSKASNQRVSLTPSETDTIQAIALKVQNNIPDLEERSSQVSWGGPHKAVPMVHWWSKPSKPRMIGQNNISNNSNNNLSVLDGGHLLYAYLLIMKWDPHPHFPFRLCGADGCPPERAISHTLQWREAYKPWLAPPSLLEENRNGYVYHRGFSPSATPNGKHGVLWLRLHHTVKHNLSFFRGILHSADRAIANALIESDGETGKFNVIIDCDGFSLKGTPTLHALQQAVTMLQDHYPNRLGMIFLVHLPRAGEAFLKIVLSLITKDVRDKIKILPSHDKPKSLAILKTVVEEDFIPARLGGTDNYSFNTEEYYLPHHRCKEKEAMEFLNTMPYHAK